jgi:hypothetical protein
MPVVVGAPDGESFKEEGSEPEGDWKMNEEWMNVEHGFQAGEHVDLLRIAGRFSRRLRVMQSEDVR